MEGPLPKQNGKFEAIFQKIGGRQKRLKRAGKSRGWRKVAATYKGPFGEPIRVTGSMGNANPFRWSTKYTDDETDLVYYGYRYYNPSTGRWLNRDPIGEEGGINLYAYVRNNPVNSFDPFGLESFQFTVTTIIRPPDAEQGVKTKHVVVVDEYGKITRVVTTQVEIGSARTGLWRSVAPKLIVTQQNS